MPRKPGTLALSRADLRLLVIHHLEQAGTAGMTKQELLAAIGPDRTSLQTLQRVLTELRDDYEAQITCGAVDRRWRLHARVAMPLEAPDHDDLLAVLMAQALIEPLADASLREHMARLVEQIDERVRERNAATALPTRKTMTSSVSLSTQVDPAILRQLVVACRRRPVRIAYASPWQPPAEPVPLQTIEPWALHMYDGAIYLRAWANDRRAPRTFRLAHIHALEPVGDAEAQAAPRQPIPADVWADESPAFGIDRDRPDVAVIRMRGGTARWVAATQWHPAQKDTWLEPNELLERTFPYRSCRELARRVASVIDGVSSIEPASLHEQVFGMYRKSPAAKYEPMINS